MAKGITIPDEMIISKIYLIRGQKVIMDRDLAKLYGVETKVLKQAVKRNISRFPEDFMFELNRKELSQWRSQYAVYNPSDKMGLRHSPFVFTEHGVLMLSSVLNSQKAIQVNIQIMRIFTRVRQALMDNTNFRLALEKLERKSDNNTKNIEVLFQYLEGLAEKKETEKPRKRIGFKLPKKKLSSSK